MIWGQFPGSILYSTHPPQKKFNYSDKFKEFISRVQPEEFSFGPNQFNVFHQSQSNLKSISQTQSNRVTGLNSRLVSLKTIWHWIFSFRQRGSREDFQFLLSPKWGKNWGVSPPRGQMGDMEEDVCARLCVCVRACTCVCQGYCWRELERQLQRLNLGLRGCK